MASGCIIDECPVCNFWIYEDDIDIVGDTFIHDRCRKQYIINFRGYSEAQYLRLMGAAELRKDLEVVGEVLKESLEFYNDRIESMKERLKELEGGE